MIICLYLLLGYIISLILCEKVVCRCERQEINDLPSCSMNPSHYLVQPGSGLINLNNTCYANAVAQAIFYTPSLCNVLEDHVCVNKG